MSDDISHQRHEPPAAPNVERLTAYLLVYPHDLIDVRRLMQKFKVSAAEFHQALQQLGYDTAPAASY